MRIASAWFLIILSTSHWLGCHVLFEVNYFIEVQHQMNQIEQQIAAEIEQETGAEGTIRLLEETEINIRGGFYLDFVFSRQIEDSVVYFTLEYPPKTLTYEMVADAKSDPTPGDNGLTLLMKGLFKEFIFPEQPVSITVAEQGANCLYSPAIVPVSVYLEIPSPPPIAA